MELKEPMKYSIILGLAGSVLIPLFYEAYANISKVFALILLGIWVLVCAVRFLRFPIKEGLLGNTCMVVYTAGIGIVMYLVIHPAAESFLTDKSRYYYLTIKEDVDFLKTTAEFFALGYILFFIKFIFIKALPKLRENSEKAGEYIDNAFDSSEDGGK